MTKYVSYLRVSTQKQGLGIDAQRAAVTSYRPVKEFVEKESGKNDDRPQLEAALAFCRATRSTLVIARLDRLSRNIAFLARLMDGDVPFVCCDNPNATPLTLHILAALAQHERELISTRTKEALAAARARGVVLGRPNPDIVKHASKGGHASAPARVEAANIHRASIRAAAEGMTGDLDSITAQLRALDVRGARGGPISRTSVRRALAA